MVSLLLSLASSASAAGLPTIAVVGVHQPTLDPAAQRAAVQQVVVAIEATGRFDGVPTPEVRTAILGRESVILEEGLLSGPREKLTLGRTAYNRAAWDEAITRLNEGIEGLRAVYPGVNNAEDLWEAYVYLGAAHLLREKPNEGLAKVAFGAAAALSPAKPINPALFPPNVVAAHEGIRAQLRSAKATLQVVAGPGANVWLDGVVRGPSPIEIPELVAGEHYVVARSATSDGFLRFTQSNNPTPRVELPMMNPTFGLASGTQLGRSAQMASLYEALAARSVGLDYILIAGADGQKAVLQLFDTRSRTYSQAVSVPLSGDATDEVLAALPDLLAGIQDDGGFASPGSAPPPIDVTTNCELALLLTERVEAAPFSGAPAFPGRPLAEVEEDKPRKKVKAGAVIGAIAGALVVGGASAGGYLFVQSQAALDPNRGVVVVEF